ncbi:hypothetical protein GDO78_022850 [Eleutherodactylus coqui]|uniref:Ig-like domain-containing protein n=1 Tax=Eleutherodactylus coqui TaxID=57060 RepID=A0A8J6EFU4_ELECQ|nr:hypothetical protein GDO78_022850 [Eleutherodactylus coqui]
MVVIEDVLQIHEGPGMGRVRTLLLLYLCHTCRALEITVPPSRVGIVGTDAVLPCTFKVDNYPISRQFLAIFWHFEENVIARYDSKTQWSTSRFTIDEQAVMQGNASLTIHNVTVTDKGKYKCMVIYSPNTQEKEIQLNILAVPVVRIQKKAVQRDVTNILQCSITNFFPNDMKVIWLKNGLVLSGSGTQDDKRNADKTFTRNSTINVIFLKEDGNPEITCQVENEYLQHPIHDSYIVQYGAAPKVNIKASRTPDGNDQIYMCEATNYFPEAMTMHWMLDGKRIDSPRQSNNEYFNKEICYRIHLDGNNLPSQISCEVQHETLYSPLMATQEVKVEHECKRSCHFGLFGVLLGLLVAVSLALWYFMKRVFQPFQVSHIHRMPTADNRVTMFCMASKWPKEMQVTWKILGKDGQNLMSDPTQARDEEEVLIKGSDYIVETDRSHSDKLHHAISTLSFTPVISKHKDMEVFCTFHCDRRNSEWRPVMGEIEKSAFKDGKEAKLLCRISGYFPNAVDMKWLRREAESQEWFDVSTSDKYKIPVMEATQQEDKTFTYTACLYLTVSAATDSGAELTCWVRHPSLKTPLERSSGELVVIGENEQLLNSSMYMFRIHSVYQVVMATYS